jgi:8-oxo-dGTP diphosphatase
VILRDRYGEEWALPKGKQEEGESLEQTALREVNEETGCQAMITGFAGTSSYYHGNAPKAVFFWKMLAADACRFTPSKEIKKLEWLTPGEALHRLTHNEERKLVAGIYDKENDIDLYLPTFSRFCKTARLIFTRITSMHRWQRLSATIDSYAMELDCRDNVFRARQTCCVPCIVRRQGRRCTRRGWCLIAKVISIKAGSICWSPNVWRYFRWSRASSGQKPLSCSMNRKN